jgi:hypothetical protein
LDALLFPNETTRASTSSVDSSSMGGMNAKGPMMRADAGLYGEKECSITVVARLVHIEEVW